MILEFINLASAGFAIVAAVRWFQASKVNVPPTQTLAASRQASQIALPQDDGRATDLFATAEASARLNAKAAGAACGAAVLQALAIAVPMILR